MKMDFLSEEKQFHKFRRIALKRSFRRIKPCENIAFRCPEKSDVTVAILIRFFTGAYFEPFEKPSSRSGTFKLSFSDSMFNSLSNGLKNHQFFSL